MEENQDVLLYYSLLVF
nr:hypothetical protein [Bacillus velezensis]